MMLSRRQSLRLMGIGTLALLPLGRRLGGSRAQEQAEQPLRIPPLLAGQRGIGQGPITLTLQSGITEFLPGQRTDTLGVNGGFLGPLVRLRYNELAQFRVQNTLAEPTTLHWHGFQLPAVMDGGPHQVIAPGDIWEPEFRVLQQAGTYWYHSHMPKNSGSQVYRGLAGMIIVDDDASDALPLPSTYGVDDVPLILQDRRFSEDGSLLYMDRFEDLMKGMHGDTLLVNGTLAPYFDVTTSLVRFRILNASNARSYFLALDDGAPLTQIASDGGLLPTPVKLTQLELAPGERAEILVDTSDGRDRKLVSLPQTPTYPEFPGGLSQIMRSLHVEAFDILSLRCATSLDPRPEVPSQLAQLSRLAPETAQRTRTFNLRMGYGSRSGEDRGPGRGMRNGFGGGYGGGNVSINGRMMEMDYINETVPVGTTEIWELINMSPMMHPFHVHNGQFQVLDRNGNPPPANELGWKDTVRVRSGETVRLIMHFGDYADASHPYMYHCHILEHEDHGMMGQFVVA